MKDFANKVAVVTGAASGIGRAIAEHCAREGMKVVLADIEEPALTEAATALRTRGATALAVQTDVGRPEDIAALARKTLDAFGAVHLLVNNAGVGAGGSAWDSTLADWKWVIGVNLWGVIYGTHSFVPIMLAQNVEAHLVNVASVAGLVPVHASAAYQVTKHAVVALSENTYYALKLQNAKVGVSVLCPGWVRTRIMDSERNRPADLRNPPELQQLTPQMEAVLQYYRAQCEAGLDPAVVAQMVFDGIRAERFYIVTTTDFDPVIQSRMESILRRLDPPEVAL
jgi:NAD(P)-dependent dehydrogenase (short-subunit alcohol dehydrogenase family)